MTYLLPVLFALSFLDAALPRIEYASLLPSKAQCKLAIQMNWDYRTSLQKRLDLQQYRDDLRTLMVITKFRCDVWNLCDDVQNPHLTVMARRGKFMQLVNMMGWDFEDLCSARLPWPIPGLGD